MDTDYTPDQQAQMEAEAIARVESAAKEALEATGDVDVDLEGYVDPTDTPILGKFKTQDDLIKAYQELEKKLGQPKADSTPTVVEDTPKEDTPPDTPKDDETVTPDDLTEFIEDYSTNGKLSEESYKKLKAMGISKQVADSYIAGQKALVDSTVAKTYESVGGKETYDAMISWAKENLTEAQKQGFNKQLATGDADVMAMAIDGLFSKYREANKQPIRIKGDAVAPQATNVYNDRTEHLKATSNRLYGNDVKYTAMVDRKYLASLQAGTI